MTPLGGMVALERKPGEVKKPSHEICNYAGG
jgi:hypothetical protein